jgi:hypothetical protein
MKSDELVDIIIKTMRYAYLQSDGQYPREIDLPSWNGIDDQPGIKDFIVSLFRDERKRGYQAGFKQGYAYGHPVEEIDVVEASHYAEKEFLKWEKDES